MSIISSSCSDSPLPEISNSLRFNGTNYCLTKTLATPTNNTVWSFSCWLKKTSTGSIKHIFSSIGTFGSAIAFTAADQLILVKNQGAAATSTAVFRDPSAHMHLCVISNGTTVKGYINSTEVVSYTGTIPDLNSAAVTRVGIDYAGGSLLDGYISNLCFIDGKAKTPSDFAYTDPNGQWRSLSGGQLKALASDGGTNSFFLDFSNGASTVTLGYDSSSKGNNWTLTNMVRNGSVDDCWSYDTPTNNFAVLNPLDPFVSGTLGTLTKGALTISAGGARASTIWVNDTSGKIYWEVTLPTIVSNFPTISIYEGISPASWNSTNIFSWYTTDGQLNYNGGYVDLTSSFILANGDTAMIAFDCTTGKIWLGKNGTWLKSGSPSTGTNPAYTFASPSTPRKLGSYANGYVANFNFGQIPVTGGAFDAASGGYFRYTPPAGFKALCVKNLGTPSIVDPSKHFDISLFTGTGSIQNITNSGGFQPDLVWEKTRSAVASNILVDSVRGATKELYSNATTAETTQANGITGFLSNGFSVGSAYAANTHVGWQWKAGGTAVSNTAGSITSQVSANVEAGFSIVTYTGTGANATVGHGLGIAPKMVIVKGRTNTRAWCTWHTGFPATDYIFLNTTAAKGTAATVWNSTAPSSMVFSIGSDIEANQNTISHVAYCFAEVPGYSKIGSYIGNAAAEGPFIWCGFQPKFVMIKSSTSATYWYVLDTERNFSNVNSNRIAINATNAETTANSIMDVLSNGFKLRDSNAEWNAAQTYIFIAFAEAPFQYANAR